LRLDLPTATSPKSLDMNTDTTVLGFHIQSIEIDRAKTP
jgi:hypothetical protein